ncbi:MAG: glycosyltransferase family 4 protein, partial [Actinobacteria bacterium]|nr:glycosyltransferase family 4 protein [Actinomycetota bacterium]
MNELRIQLWSYNYAPEPTGIGPVSKSLAEGLRDLGHDVHVVAAHPHYPEPRWGKRLTPYREVRNGVPVLRLPLWIGRSSAAQRYRQELSFMAAQFAALPALGAPDIIISASPSFPALLPAIVNVRARRVPWLLWLHDLLPDGATSSGLVDNASPIIKLARLLERASYHRADQIVVLSSAFTRNLVAKNVPEGKIRLIFDPATRTPRVKNGSFRRSAAPLRVLSMGNIGYSQGLAPLVSSFERALDRAALDVELRITGNGLAAADVRKEIRSDRVKMLGVVDDDDLEDELRSADVALVSQNHHGAEFNIPSKIMNFMMYGLPVLAAVNPDSEVARIVEKSGGGWVVDSG